MFEQSTMPYLAINSTHIVLYDVINIHSQIFRSLTKSRGYETDQLQLRDVAKHLINTNTVINYILIYQSRIINAFIYCCNLPKCETCRMNNR